MPAAMARGFPDSVPAWYTGPAGATCSITDPIKLGQTIRAADLLLGKDDFAMRYIKYFRAAEKLKEQEAVK